MVNKTVIGQKYLIARKTEGFYHAFTVGQVITCAIAGDKYTSGSYGLNRRFQHVLTKDLEPYEQVKLGAIYD